MPYPTEYITLSVSFLLTPYDQDLKDSPEMIL